ncbi:hypothetical protein Dimus_010100 [Dionaea muscipula]
MQSLIGSLKSLQRRLLVSSNLSRSNPVGDSIKSSDGQLLPSIPKPTSSFSLTPRRQAWPERGPIDGINMSSLSFLKEVAREAAVISTVSARAFPQRCFMTAVNPAESVSQDCSTPTADMPPRIKFKRLDKTARNIMQILNKEAVEEVKAQREIPDVRPGYIVQLKMEVPENKRRVTTIKGIIIARRNSGISTTFRLRRMVAGVGVESLFPLYSPNIKEIKVLDKKKVNRAKLYYLRDKMNALKK